MKHEKSVRRKWRWLALLLVSLLWGGGLTADAAERAWAKYDAAATTLTFYYGEKGELGTDEYELNEGSKDPGWLKHKSDITRVVFDDSFVEARPKSCNSWFAECVSLTEIEGIGNMNTSEVTDMGYMFNRCYNLEKLDLSNFNTGKVVSMVSMFRECYMIKSIFVSEKFVVENVKYYSDMFGFCYSLKGGIDYNDNYSNNKDFAKIKGGYFLFKGPWAKYDAATTTLTFYFGEKATFGEGEYMMNVKDSPDWLEHKDGITRVVFDESFAEARPKSCNSWFENCEKLTEIEGISKLNTSEVTDMRSMFHNCCKLTVLDVSGFNTVEVTDMCNMFRQCSKLAYLNLSGFSTANVTNMVSMFSDCPLLQVISASDQFLVKEEANSEAMFYGCTSLRGDIAYDANLVDKTYATIDGGYLLSSDKEAKLMWAGFADGTLTFYFGEKATLGDGEYWMNVNDSPDWLEHSSDITRVVFDDSFVEARPKSCYHWFEECVKLTEIEGMSNLNTSEVTDMNSMFCSCRELTAIDLSRFNTEKVTYMNYVFFNCSSLASLDLSNFNTEKVTSMLNMFCFCEKLASVNLSGFSTANVTGLMNMFRGCYSLKVIYASDKFVVRDDARSDNMFYGCTSLYGDIAFNSDYTDGTYATVDGGYFIDKQYVRPWAQYADGTLTFRYGYKKTFGNDEYGLGEWNGLPNGWVMHRPDITKVVFDASFAQARPQSCNSWFYYCSGMKTIEGLEYLNTSEVTDMAYMFYHVIALSTLDLSSFNTSKVTDMSGMFGGCYMLQAIYAGDDFVVQEQTNTENMFEGCVNLQGDIAFDANHTDKTYAKTDGGYLVHSSKEAIRPWAQYADGTLTFYYGKKKVLGEGEYGMNAQDVPGWKKNHGSDITKVVFDASFAQARPKSCCSWFQDCGKLATIEGLENLNTSEVTSMSSMFEGCPSLASIDLSNFNTSKVTDMYHMFAGCNNLTALDLSTFNTSKVTIMDSMFSGCQQLLSICVSDGFVVDSVSWSGDMFRDCTSLKGDIAYNADNVDKTYATLSNGYFLFKGPWAEFADGTLTFRYGVKQTDGSDGYLMNADKKFPGWLDHKDDITKVVFDASFAQARPTTCYGWFYNCYNLAAFEGMEYLNTSEVTDMCYMFSIELYGHEDGSKLTQLDLSHFDTQKVTEMGGMFQGCKNLVSLDVSKFDTRNVTNMSSMFEYCESLDTLDVSKIDTRNVTNMRCMFGSCTGLTSLDLSHFDTRNVTDMSYLFNGCFGLTSLDVSKFDTRNVTDMAYLFSFCPGLTELKLSNFDTSNTTSFSAMFVGCTGLTSLDLSHFDTQKAAYFNQMFQDCSGLASLDVSHFDTHNAKRMHAMFKGCTGLTSLDLSKFNTSKVSTMWAMFDGCISLKSLDLSGFDTRNAYFTLTDFFYGCKNLQTIYAGDNFSFSNEVATDSMFAGCTSLYGDIAFNPDHIDGTFAKIDGGYFTDKQYTRPWAQLADGTLTFRYGYKTTLDESQGEYAMNEGDNAPGWNGKGNSITRVVLEPSLAYARPKSCYEWFYDCQMTAIEGLENLNTSEVTNMYGMFSGCSNLQRLDLSHFDTRKVTDGTYVGGMELMFNDCSSLTSLDLSSFDTSGVTDITYMFNGCANLDTLDLSSFDTQKVTKMGYMFQDCSKLQTVYASDKFVITADTWGNEMFRGCTSLKGNIAFDPNYIHATYASTDGYFIDKKYIRPWAKLTDGTLTFQYGYKKNLGSGEYTLNEGMDTPEWIADHSSDITKAVFDPSFAQARPTTCLDWFFGCRSLTDIDGIEHLNTSDVTVMSRMFGGCSSLTTLDLSGFDTRNVTNMNAMFGDCTQLQSIYVSDKFTTDKVIDSPDIFGGCTSLMGAIAFNPSSVDKTHANIEGYFLDKQYVRPWAKIEDGMLTFRYGYKKTLDSEKWEFELNEGNKQPLWNDYCDKFAKVVFDPSFAKARPKSCSYWFQGVRGDVEGIKYLNTSEVKYMHAMFRRCGLSSLDLSGFDTRNVETMNSMFEKCSELTSLDLSSFDTQRVTDMNYMFEDDSQLQTIYVSDKFTTDGVNSDAHKLMFYGCTSLKGNIAYDANVTDKTHANALGYFTDLQYLRPWVGYDESTRTLNFRYSYKVELENGEYALNEVGMSPDWSSDYAVCQSAAKAVFDPSFAQARPVSCRSWFDSMENLRAVDGIGYLNTSEVTDMNSMFYRCIQLASLDLSGFDTRKVTDMSYLFDQCSQLASLDLTKFDTQNVTDMSYMFYNAGQLASLDLSGFDTKKVKSMERMFSGTEQLKAIYLGRGFNTAAVESTYDMFFWNNATLYCLPDCYESLRDNNVLAEVGKEVKPYVPINAQAEYGTLCVPVGSRLAEGTFVGFDKLYAFKTADTDKATVTLTETSIIEPGVPYVYHRQLAVGAPSIIAFEADDEADIVQAPQNDGSQLKGTFEPIIAPSGSYILQMDGMFHPVAAGNTTLTVGAYRAWLDLNTLGEGGAELSKSLRIVFGGNATGIDGVDDFGISDYDNQPEVYFDLSGRRVSHPQRGGVYIVKGKKVIKR